MIDVNLETLLSIEQTCREPFFCGQTGQPAHLSKIYRAMEPGFRDVHGVRVSLEFVKAGGIRKTSREAIQRFARRLTEPDAPEAEPTSPKPSRRIRREQAEAETADI